jgi:hypothetical protein
MCIMDMFCHQGVSTPDLCRLNHCHLYLQVACLSDTTTIAGTHLYNHVLLLDRQPKTTLYPTYPTSKHTWPWQPRPGPKAHLLWSKCLCFYFFKDNGQLQPPLGKWHTPVENRDRHYPTLYQHIAKLIHQFDGTVYRQLPIQHLTEPDPMVPESQPTPSNTTYSPLHCEAGHQQAIGWQQFLQGRIAQSLLNYQEHYYRAREWPANVT